MEPLVLKTPAPVPQQGSSLCYGCCLCGKTRADGEPASVTDETPARDSAGRCSLVDQGLPYPPPPWF